MGEDGRVFQIFGGAIHAYAPDGAPVAQIDTGFDIDAALGVFNTGTTCCNQLDFIFASPKLETGLMKFDQGLQLVWQVPFLKHSGQVSSPVFDAQGDIYVGVSEFDFLSLDQEGEVRWSYSTDAQHIDGTAAIHNGVIVFGAGDGFLYALGQGLELAR